MTYAAHYLKSGVTIQIEESPSTIEEFMARHPTADCFTVDNGDGTYTEYQDGEIVGYGDMSELETA